MGQAAVDKYPLFWPLARMGSSYALGEGVETPSGRPRCMRFDWLNWQDPNT